MQITPLHTFTESLPVACFIIYFYLQQCKIRDNILTHHGKRKHIEYSNYLHCLNISCKELRAAPASTAFSKSARAWLFFFKCK